MESWTQYLDDFDAGLRGLAVTTSDGTAIAPSDAFDHWVQQTHDVHERGGSIYFAGNGGSAMIASHMAVDACKNGGLRALAFNDPASLTAVANDLAFDEVFALPLRRFARPGDLLMTISSSGNSPNILRVLDAAAEIGLYRVTLSGMRPENGSRARGHLNFYVPAPRYGWVESAHQLIIHHWFDQYLNRHGQGAV